MDLLTAIGLAAPAGLNAYIPLLGVAFAQNRGWIQLAKPFDLMGEWWVILIIAALLAVEILADKFPAVDHVNDLIQTFVRPAAGAILAVGASGSLGKDYPIVMVVLGVIVAGSVHAAKATTRPAVNVTTGGLGAPVVSFIEDVLAVISTIVAIVAPILVLVVVALGGWGFWRLWQRKKRAKVDPAAG
jgi:uncharacterized membrane protein